MHTEDRMSITQFYSKKHFVTILYAHNDHTQRDYTKQCRITNLRTILANH